MAVGAGIGLLSWNVVNLIASAWEVCADLDAPDRAGLTILYFPGIIVAMGLAAAVAARLTKRHHPVLRIGLVMLAVGLVAVLVIALSVPYGGESSWPSGDSGEAFTECRVDGIPNWWPAWLPT